MLNSKSSPKKLFPSKFRLQLDKKILFRQKNQQNSTTSPRVLQNNNQNQQLKKPVQNSIPIKDYKLKIRMADFFSLNRLVQRKSSIISNIYRPFLDKKDQSEVKNYMDNKNMNLIKENIKKLELNLSAGAPNLLKNHNRTKFHSSSFVKHESKTERSIRQSRKEQIFLFPDEPESSTRKLFAKRKLSFHFDRSKYFNCEPFLSKQHQNDRSIKQRTEYGMNSRSQRSRSRVIEQQKKENYSQNYETAPIIRQRTIKPKTAGGFLKKYSVEEISIRPDFQLHLNEEDIF